MEEIRVGRRVSVKVKTNNKGVRYVRGVVTKISDWMGKDYINFEKDRISVRTDSILEVYSLLDTKLDLKPKCTLTDAITKEFYKIKDKYLGTYCEFTSSSGLKFNGIVNKVYMGDVLIDDDEVSITTTYRIITDAGLRYWDSKDLEEIKISELQMN